MANTKVPSELIADNSVGITQLNVSDGTNGQVLTTDGAGTLSFSTISGYTDSDVETYLNTSAIYTDATNDRLGVGTSNPATKLDVSVVGGMARVGGAAGNNLFQTYTGSVGAGIWAGGQTRLYSTGSMTLSTGATLTTSAPTGYTDAVTIDSSGNVGIGISTIEQLGSDSVYPRIQSYSSATSGHFCGLMIGRPNSAGLESSLAFTVGGIMVGKIQHDYVAENHNDMSFHLRGSSGNTDLEVMRLWAGSGSDTALLVGRTTRSWANADFEVDSNARIGNIYFTGSGSDSTLSAGNANFKISTLTFTGGATDLDFDVNVVVTGVGIANRFKVDSPTGDTYTNDGTISSLSDIRVKTDINDLTDGLEIVKQLRPVTFKYNDNSIDDDGNGMLAAADDKIRYGFIAQEVEEVAPHYVETSTRKINNEEVDDFKSLSTTRMIPMLFKAIQELSAKLEAAEARIETLENS